jgi:hypothetical protein
MSVIYITEVQDGRTLDSSPPAKEETRLDALKQSMQARGQAKVRDAVPRRMGQRAY